MGGRKRDGQQRARQGQYQNMVNREGHGESNDRVSSVQQRWMPRVERRRYNMVTGKGRETAHSFAVSVCAWTRGEAGQVKLRTRTGERVYGTKERDIAEHERPVACLQTLGMLVADARW